MRGREFLGWFAGALAALVVLGLAAVLSPLPHVEPHPQALAPLQPPETPAAVTPSAAPEASTPASGETEATAPQPAPSAAPEAAEEGEGTSAPSTAATAPAEPEAATGPDTGSQAVPATGSAETPPSGSAEASGVAPPSPGDGTAPSDAAPAAAATVDVAPAPAASPETASAQTPAPETAPAATDVTAPVPDATPNPTATPTADAPPGPTAAAQPATAPEPAPMPADAATEAGATPPAASTAPEAAAPAPAAAPVVSDAAPAQPVAAAAPPSVAADAPLAAAAPAAVAAAPQPLSPDAAPPAVVESGALSAPSGDAAPVVAPAPTHLALQEPAAVPSDAPSADAPAGTEPAAPAAPPLADAVPGGAGPAAAPDKPRVLTLGPDSTPRPGTLSTLKDNKPSTLPGAGSLIDRNRAAAAPGTMEPATPETAPETAPEAAPAAALPQIGKPDAASPGTLPQIGKSAAPASAEGLPPIAANARAFTPIDPAKPLFVLMLRDIGAAGMDRDTLLKLPFPVTVVLDPLAPDAPDVMRAWRDAGQEVVLSATGLPVGAEASDVAQTFQALETSLPETVAVIDATGATFQNDRPLASLVVPEIQAGGRGLVTIDEGLDAADQIARRAGLPAARIFRRLDAAGESRDTIRRYLDRAAFKAAQDGMVVVMGDTRPETIAAILEWTVEGRAASVNLAPLTAVLNRPR